MMQDNGTIDLPTDANTTNFTIKAIETGYSRLPVRRPLTLIVRASSAPFSLGAIYMSVHGEARLLNQDSTSSANIASFQLTSEL